MKNKTNIFYILLLFVLFSCGEDRTEEFFEQTKENQWVYNTMKSSYLWSEQIKPQERSKFFAKPDAFFKSLLYSEDKASFFTDSVYSGDYGLTCTLMRDPIAVQPSKVYALVLFVEPNSPAALAGIERGMWISAVGDKSLSASSTALLEIGEETKLAVEYIEYDDVENKKFWVQSDSVTLGASALYAVSDIVVDTVYPVRDNNVGYILCNGFNDNDFIKRINTVAEEFISSNITDVVIDLRYNNNGSLANVAYLASMLVPSTLANTPFATLKKGNEDVDTVYNYSHTEFTLCDKRVFFITGADTKGVSELLISSVNASRDAYDVMVVGDKTAGSNVMVENIVSPYGFSINPATSYAYSSDGNLISADGIKPDYELSETKQTEQIYPLGSSQEYLLYNVMYLISNGSLPQN